jgi:hypothetical protein
LKGDQKMKNEIKCPKCEGVLTSINVIERHCSNRELNEDVLEEVSCEYSDTICYQFPECYHEEDEYEAFGITEEMMI